MPIDWNTKASFDAAYNIRAERTGVKGRKPVRLGYTRVTMWPICQARASAFVDVFNLTPASRVVIIGAGFGWTAESLRDDHGITNVIGTDLSTYIFDNKNSSEDADVEAGITKVGLDPARGEGAALKTTLMDGREGLARSSVTVLENGIGTKALRDDVVAELGGEPTLILTEHVLSGQTDQAAQSLDSQMHKLAAAGGASVAHFVGTEVDPAEYNQKPLADWKALLPNSTIVNTGTYEVA